MAEDHNNMHCAINAFAGKEATLSLEKAAKPKKVMVVGGGPGGMEAARVAAIRGHSVTLYDRLGRLGGTLLFADTVHPDNDRLLNYLTAEIRSLPIRLKLGTEVTPELVAAEKPDAVILATGPNLTVARIPGSDRRNVFSGPDMKRMLGGNMNGAAARLPAWQRWALTIGSPFLRFLDAPKIRWATRYWMPIGKRVAVIGGDLAACELAAFLGERKRKVTLLEASKVVAPDVMHKRRFEVRHSLQEAGVTVADQVEVRGDHPGRGGLQRQGRREEDRRRRHRGHRRRRRGQPGTAESPGRARFPSSTRSATARGWGSSGGPYMTGPAPPARSRRGGGQCQPARTWY